MDEKEALLFMRNAIILRQSEMEITKAMEGYVVAVKTDVAKNPEKARKEARKALVRTGVMTTKGSLKKKIVSWE